MRPSILSTKTVRRLIAWLMLLMVIILAGVAVYVYGAYQRATSELVIARDRQVAYLSAIRLKDELSNYADVLAVLTRTPEIYQGDLPAQQAALLEARHRLAVFDGGVVLLDNFGRVRAAQPARPDIIGGDWSSRNFFGQVIASEGAVFSDAEDFGSDGVAVIIAVPVRGDRGEFAGALAGTFRLGKPEVSSFYASIVRLRMGQGGNTYVIDGSGRILYDSGYTAVGKTFKNSGPDALSVRGEGTAVRTQDPDGHEIVAAYAPVPGTNWTLVTEDDWQTLMGATQRYTGIMFGLIALGILLPAMGVVLLVRQRDAEAVEHEHTEYEAQAAEIIQRSLLPRHMPVLPGWSLAVSYRSSHAYGGDFYDYLFLPDGRLMLTLGDISDRGIQAAMEMAAIRTTLRSAARHMLTSCEALEESNELLCPEMRPGVAACCIYSVLDPSRGHVEFANAGQLVPLFKRGKEVLEMGTPGQPLGQAVEVQYEHREEVIEQGESLVFYSDGLIEARNAEGEKFGLPRLKAILAGNAGSSQAIIDAFLSEFSAFTGKGWIAEDDVTLMVLMRTRQES